MTERIIYQSEFEISLEEQIDDLEEKNLEALRKTDRKYIDKRLGELREMLAGESDKVLLSDTRMKPA